jgi:lysophospholipase L1-like esterase
VSTYEQRSSTPPILNWDQSMLGCSLFPGDSVFAGRTLPDGPQCAPWRNDRTRWLQAFHPQVVMLLSGVWETYDREVDGRRLDFGTPEFDTWFSRHLDALDAELTSTGARLAILTAPCNEREVVSGPEPPENDNARIDHLNRLYERAAARHPGTTAIVDLHQRVCPGGRYVDHVDGTPLRSDGVHFTAAGSALTRAWLFPKLAALATRGS